MLDLAYGIPVYDIFGRVCGHMDAQAGEACFRQWVQELQKLTQSHVNATDGRTCAAPPIGRISRAPQHVVSAWASDAIVLFKRVFNCADQNLQ